MIRWLQVLVILVVLTIWVAGVIVGMKDHSYQLPPSVHLAFSMVMGFLIGDLRVGIKRDNDKGPK